MGQIPGNHGDAWEWCTLLSGDDYANNPVD